jgi:phage terminase large subunit-like protein
MAWDLSCRDWQDRIRAGTSLIPKLPLYEAEGEIAVKFFDALRLPDVAGLPLMRDASGPWFRDIVRALFGSRDPVTNVRYVEEIFALVAKKNSKAIALDTLIATPTGFVTMGNVRIGDAVMDANGQPTKVTAKSEVFVGHDCFEVVFSTGESVVCDAEHLWITDAHKDREKRRGHHRNAESPSAKTTREIAASLKVSSGRYVINNHRTALCGKLDCPQSDLKIPPYALGLWLGDGTTSQAQITAGLAEADILVGELVANGQPAFVRSRYPEKGSTTISLTIPGTVNLSLPYRFRTEAIKLGLLGRKHIPQSYLRASNDQRMALLRGLMDSDGSIAKSGQAAFTTTLECLRDDVRELINSLGFKSTVSEHRAKIYGKDCGPVWFIQFWPFDTAPVFSLAKKLVRQMGSKAKNSARSKTRQIVDVRKVKSVPVQCIAVASKTHQYLVTRSLIPTHNTTNGAALMLTAMLMNGRPRAEFLFVGPTQAISDLAFSQATGMIEADPELKRRFLIREHVKEIKDRLNGAKLRIKTFDLDILTGPRPAGVLLDELHLLGKHSQASKVLRQLRGGRQSIPEGFMVILTTQSDEPPAGAFREELTNARAVRDGRAGGIVLPVLYEFPPEYTAPVRRDQTPAWYDPSIWHMVMPNLGRSLRIEALVQDFETEKLKGESAIRVWASQHLNIEIGISLLSDRWAGADFWQAAAEPELADLDTLLDRCEVATVGIDGGGLDDLLGVAVAGREKVTRRWLLWTHAWAHQTVLDRRKEIAPALRDFAAAGDLTIVETPGQDVEEVADIVERVQSSGILPLKNGIGVDPVGIGQILDALVERNMPEGCTVAVSQGWKLSGAIKTAERGLSDLTLVHGGQAMMAWCVGNAKVEPRGNAITITKQAAGTAKIDPLMASFNAISLLSLNPDGVRSVYEEIAAEPEPEKPDPNRAIIIDRRGDEEAFWHELP